MKKRVAGLWLLIALLASAAEQPEVFRAVDAITAKLAEFTGMPLKRKVPAASINKAQLDRYLRDRIAEESKPEEIRAEELTLRRLGFIKDGFNLKETLIEVLNEQAAAFYDTRKKRLFVLEKALEESSGPMQEVVLVHELGHALADQYFNLEKFIKQAGKSDDGHLARMAVMEGQATWLMTEYQSQRNGGSIVGKPELIAMMSRPASLSTGEYPALEKSPRYLQETLLFPYSRGMAFQAAVRDKLGKEGFAEVFRRAPESTQQVLHPEFYFDKTSPETVEFPAVKLDRQWKTLSEGTLGELDHQVLLKDYGIDEAEEKAEAWRGGVYRLLETKDRKRAMLLHATVWKTEADATAFFQAYVERVLPGKVPGFAVEQSKPDLLTGQCDWGKIRVERNGRRVSAVEGE